MSTPSEEIDNMIEGLPDWRGQKLAGLRKLINDADPALKEGWKWGTPVWIGKGNVVALGAFQEHVKVAFFNGASLEDPSGLFNASLDAKDSRSIDLRENESIDEEALQSLIRAAVEHDGSRR